ncbi:hypothetical protein Pmani_039194 [Petrolisthes manimaculis]|uniref:Uncharacterized protein n=1 Tax=Petrolisthes manimaculis TaxID=1843537 RepID=A0AAE1NE62_9EUCA|nr:hypothetical protein Pmani_039194 [Petrolisthes manimaculis]
MAEHTGWLTTRLSARKPPLPPHSPPIHTLPHAHCPNTPHLTPTPPPHSPPTAPTHLTSRPLLYPTHRR